MQWKSRVSLDGTLRTDKLLAETVLTAHRRVCDVAIWTKGDVHVITPTFRAESLVQIFLAEVQERLEWYVLTPDK